MYSFQCSLEPIGLESALFRNWKYTDDCFSARLSRLVWNPLIERSRMYMNSARFSAR